tara:strand:+ start:8264 stop:8716 length:453 start_codon:yes stop_codon:yes gene_type:complete
MATIKLSDFNITLSNAATTFSKEKIKAIQLPVLKLYEGLSKYRIFNEGKASDSSLIGKYRSLSYRKARQARGRQTGYKDLEFEGDLRRSLTVGTNGKDFVFGFATDAARLIGAGQEKQTKKDIWNPTTSEENDINKATAKLITKCLKTVF